MRRAMKTHSRSNSVSKHSREAASLLAPAHTHIPHHIGTSLTFALTEIPRHCSNNLAENCQEAASLHHIPSAAMGRLNRHSPTILCLCHLRVITYCRTSTHIITVARGGTSKWNCTTLLYVMWQCRLQPGCLVVAGVAVAVVPRNYQTDTDMADMAISVAKSAVDSTSGDGGRSRS
ncbi:hypothetical protein Pelo_8175 [Pelomyxa schiedti]|nr:hypothetical protein Pelo_8175 [Pelomyxa schiedti]